MNLDIGHGPEDRRDRKLAYLHHLCDRHGQEVARQLSVAGLDLAESRAEFDALAQRVIRALDLSEAEAELENLSRIWPAVTYLGLDQSGVWQLPISQVSQWARLCRVVLRGFDGEETLTSIAETYAPNYFAKLSRGLDDLAHECCRGMQIDAHVAQLEAKSDILVKATASRRAGPRLLSEVLGLIQRDILPEAFGVVLEVLAYSHVGQLSADLSVFFSAVNRRQISHLQRFSDLPARLVEPLSFFIRLGNSFSHTHVTGFSQRVLPVHSLEIPGSVDPQHWRYLTQRLQQEVAKFRSHPGRGTDGIGKALRMFVLQLAAKTEGVAEEVHFTELLQRRNEDDTAVYYRHRYHADQQPAPHGTEQGKQLFRESQKLILRALLPRTGLNVLRGYTTRVLGQPWLLSRMAEAMGAEVTEIHSRDAALFPGSGCVISGLKLDRFLDMTTGPARRFYLDTFPTLRTVEKHLPAVRHYFYRSFIASVRADDHPDCTGQEVGNHWDDIFINGVPYGRVVWSDHFAAWSPEQRVWLVPEAVLHQLLQPLSDTSQDPADSAFCPERVADLAHSMGLPILNVASAGTLYAGMGHSWPHGSPPYWRWELPYRYYTDPYRDPDHHHKAFRLEGQYSAFENDDINAFFAELREAQTQVARCLAVWSGCYEAFLVGEGAFAKEGISSGAEPGRLALEDVGERPSEREAEEEGHSSAVEALSFDVDFPRTRMLKELLNLRQALFARGKTEPSDFPNLRIHYTNSYAVTPGTPWIDGYHLILHLADGQTFPLFRSRPGLPPAPDVSVDEHSEALWFSHVSSQWFGLYQTPRIVWG